MLLHLFLVATCLIHIDAVGATASSSIASSANVTNTTTTTTTTTTIGMNCSSVLNTTATMGFNESSVFHDADTPCFLAYNETRSNLTTRGDSAEVPVQSTGNPSATPTGSPTWAPSVSPTTEVPTTAPSTVAPTLQPTTPKPTPQPTDIPTVQWFGFWPTYSPSKTTDRTIHILPLGDSITSNGFGYLSYRYFLWKSFLTDPRVLESLGTQSIEYAGMLSNGYNGNPDWPPVAGQTFDQRHEGHWGWTTDAVVGELNAWLGASNAAFDCCSQKPYPDIALVHLGTNDCIYGEPVPQVSVSVDVSSAQNIVAYLTRFECVPLYLLPHPRYLKS